MKISKKIVWPLSIILLVFLITFSPSLFFYINREETDNRTMVQIAVPYTENLSYINDQYYTLWLEEQTGYNIEYVFLPQAYTHEYLQKTLLSSTVVDAVFFSAEYPVDTTLINEYGKSGQIADLTEFISDSTYALSVLETYEKYSLPTAISSTNGSTYYLPAFSTESTDENFQTMWINTSWLDQLGLAIPSTPQEFSTILQAFSTYKTNAVPIIGTLDNAHNFPFYFLMNAFSICNPTSHFFAYVNDSFVFPPKTDDWREGLAYCHSLYQYGLVPPENFTYSVDELIGICNDSRDLVGVFTSQNLSDLLSENSPELLSKFLPIQPLSLDDSGGNAILELPIPNVGGVILNSSSKKEEVFQIMDLMCSEQAYLIGHFGEEGKDWDYAAIGDISAIGEPAVITVHNESSLLRESTILSAGPFFAPQKFADNVAWKGYQVNQSTYLQARAYRNYEPYYLNDQPNLYILCKDNPALLNSLESLSQYINTNMIAFITGSKDISNDSDWNHYLEGLYQYRLNEILITLNEIY